MSSCSKIVTARPILIPWIIVLAVSFLANVMTPDFHAGGKHEKGKEVTLSQVAGDNDFAGRASTPLLKLPALPSEDFAFFLTGYSLVLLYPDFEDRASQAKRGVVHGRAPPTAAIA